MTQEDLNSEIESKVIEIEEAKEHLEMLEDQLEDLWQIEPEDF